MTCACHKIVPARRHGLSTLALAAALGTVLVWALPAMSETTTTGSTSSRPMATQQQGSSASGQQQAASAGMNTGHGSQQGQSLAKELPDRYKLSSWMGKKVTNGQGKTLGTVKDVVMDDFGIVRYVIMKSDASGSQMSSGQNSSSQASGSQASGNQGTNRLVAVPVGHFEYPLARKDNLVLDVSPEQMQQAPSFSSNQYPDMGDESVSSVIVAYWVPEDVSGGQGQSAAGAGQHGQGSGSGMSGQQSAAAGSTGQSGGGMGSTTGQGSMAGRGNQYDPNRDMVYLDKQHNQMFDKLDRNGNGVIDRDEAKGNERLSNQFDNIDSYGNDAITRSEFSAFEPKGESSGMGGYQSNTGSQGQSGDSNYDRQQGTSGQDQGQSGRQY